MASRLSSLLVRDGLVGVKRMERAFQRQVIYGGSLDTILLEMSLVPEDRLIQYLSLATGLPPATFEEAESWDAAAAESCSLELALRYRVAPLTFDGDALRVLVHDPVDMNALEDFANQVGVAVQPLVVPEYRYHVVFARVFDREPDIRYAKLAEATQFSPRVAPVGRAATVIVDEPPAHAESEAASRKQTETRELTTDAIQARVRTLDERERAESEGDAARADTAQAVTPQPEPTPAAVPAATPSGADGGAAGGKGKRTQRMATEVDSVDTSPLTPAEAQALLSDADDRDEIFIILLRAMRSRAEYSALLSVRGELAVGRVALNGELIDRTDISAVRIELDNSPAFAGSVRGASPYIGKLTGDQDALEDAFSHMGGVVPPSGLLLPISIRGRVMAVAVAHRHQEQFHALEASDLLPLAASVSEALARLIVRKKSPTGGPPPSSSSGANGHSSSSFSSGGGAPAQASDAAPSGHSGAATADPVDPDATPAVPMPTLPEEEEHSPRAAHALLDYIEAGGTRATDAFEQAATAGGIMLHALEERFPGRIDHPFESPADLRSCAETGPLLALVARLGPLAERLVADKMVHGDPEVRLYATVCANELRTTALLPALVRRLFDSDSRVSGLAIASLRSYSASDRAPAMEAARRALHGTNLDQMQACAAAVAALGDAASIPDLIDALGRRDAGAESARQALVAITRRDFGRDLNDWRNWWSNNHNKTRIEWMLDGLGNQDPDVRRLSVEELRAVTGETFGYQFDLPRQEREAARHRWEQWWSGVGRHRFPTELPRNRT